MVTTQPDATSQIAGLIFALVLLDPEGRIAELNHSAENMIGQSAKRLVGVRFSDAVELRDQRITGHLAAPDAALVARNVALRLDHRDRQVNITFSPVPSSPGWRVVTLSEAGRDAENRDEGEENEMLGAPGILAHEIKNPLAAIRGASQLVERKLADKDRKLARMIASEVDRIARLIDRMQQLGRQSSEPVKPCNLHEAIRSAIATVRAGSESDVNIVEEFDPSLPPVLANRDALEQVLINLISNARDAVSDLEDARIEVRTRFVSGLVYSAIRLGRKVKLPIELTVTDNGPGVPKSMADHIFDPFVSSKKSGQGLGLALVRKLLRDMDGRINHERDANAGLTHFRIHLPMARREEK